MIAAIVHAASKHEKNNTGHKKFRKSNWQINAKY